MVDTQKKENYLKNRDLLRNIHLSKATYTWYIDGDWKTTRYLDYDFIACAPDMYDECRQQLLLQVINNKRIKNQKRRTSTIKEEDLELVTREDYQEINKKIVKFDGEFNDEIIARLKLGKHNRHLYERGKKRVSELPDDVDFDLEDLVLRVYSFDHIPDDPDKDYRKVKKVADKKLKVNFPPYQHYAIVDGDVTCVALSHHDSNKEFSIEHGKIHDKLAMGFIKLCQRNSRKYNWKGYSYIEDMQGQALVQLSIVGLQFNELFSSNPFSYYTTTVNNAFTGIFNEEKEVQNFRDKLLMKSGNLPSSTKQYENEESRSEYWDEKIGLDQMKPGEVIQIDPASYEAEQSLMEDLDDDLDQELYYEDD